MTTDLAGHRKVRQAASDVAPATNRSRLLDLAARVLLLRRGLLSIADQAVVSGTSFATAVIIGRASSPRELGLYYLTLTIVLVLAGIQENVIAAPYTVFCSRRQGQDLAEYTGSTWAQHLVLTAASTLVLLAAIIGSTIVGAVEILPGICTLLAASPLLLLREGIRRFAFARLQLTTAIAIDSAVAILQLAGLLLLSHLRILSLFTIFGMMGGACALACLGWFVFEPQSVRFVRERFLQDCAQNWSFGKWALACYLLGNTTQYTLPWILNLAAGPAPTGVFGACGTLIGLTGFLVTGAGNFLTPKAAHAFASGGVHELRRTLVTTAALLAFVLGLFCIAIVLTGDRLAVLIYGGRFSGCGAILATLALSLLVASLGMVAGNGLWALGQPRANILPDICASITAVFAAAFLVSPYGVLGAAIGMLVGTSMGTLLRTFALRQAMMPHQLEAMASCAGGREQ